MANAAWVQISFRRDLSNNRLYFRHEGEWMSSIKFKVYLVFYVIIDVLSYKLLLVRLVL